MAAPVKELPPLSPQQQTKIDEFHAGMVEMLDRYVAGVEIDMNRHAVKHGQMPEERMVFDLTRILSKQVGTGELTQQSMCGMVAVAIARGIAKKRGGRA